MDYDDSNTGRGIFDLKNNLVPNALRWREEVRARSTRLRCLCRQLLSVAPVPYAIHELRPPPPPPWCIPLSP